MGQIPTRTLTFVRALTALAGLVSAYLLASSLHGGHLAGCDVESGCHDVLASPWAYWLGLPVSGLALVLYGAMFVTTWLVGGRTSSIKTAGLYSFLVIAALIILVAAVWFIGLQVFVVGRLCPYCLAAHGAGAGAAILILRRGFRPSPAVIGSAVMGAAILLGGQLVARPPTHEVSRGSGAAVIRGTPDKSRQLTIFAGMFQINVDEVPLIGPRDAPAIMVALLDYTCRHCRQMHAVLLEAVKAYGGRLAVASLPMPLDASCNKLIPRTAPPHIGACQYARLALAVWRADPTKMDRFNDWLFEPAIPPVLESALGYAQEIVGEEALGRAMNDPWVERQLAQNLAIYEAAYRRFGKGVMPQLIIGDNIVFGELENGMKDLHLLLRDIIK